MTTINKEAQSRRKYYKLGEVVFIKPLGVNGAVHSISVPDKKMWVSYGDGKLYEGNFWMFDKVENASSANAYMTIQFAQFEKDAIVPYRAGVDEAGYDVFLNLKEKGKHLNPDGSEKYLDVNGKVQFTLEKLEPHMLPTGVGVKSQTSKHIYFNFSNERGSTGKRGLMMVSGIVDKTYRGAVFINIVPLFTTVISEYISEPEFDEESRVLYYPYSLAICQMIPYEIPQSKAETIPLSEFALDKTYRGSNKMGSTNGVPKKDDSSLSDLTSLKVEPDSGLKGIFSKLFKK